MELKAQIIDFLGVIGVLVIDVIAENVLSHQLDLGVFASQLEVIAEAQVEAAMIGHVGFR